MYIRRNIRVAHIFDESWRFALLAFAWAAAVFSAYEFLGLRFIALPVSPVLITGLVAGIYLVCKAWQSYGRWSEANMIWAEIAGTSRAWGNAVCHMIHDDTGRVDYGAQLDLVRRHIAWVHALACQMRMGARIRDNSRDSGQLDIHQHKDSYLRHLEPEEISIVEASANPATQILRLQGADIRDLVLDGQLDTVRQTAFMDLIARFHDCQSRCERIAETLLPRQIASFGTLIMWLFVGLLPFGLLDASQAGIEIPYLFTVRGIEYMAILVPFSVVISWVFYVMAMESGATEYPFEGSAHDVPVSALSTTIEIDLKQMMGMENVPAPIKPVGDVLY